MNTTIHPGEMEFVNPPGGIDIANLPEGIEVVWQAPADWVPQQFPPMPPPSGTVYNLRFLRRYNLPGKIMDPELLNAAISGNVKILESLVKTGLQVLSEMTAGGETALHIASRKGRKKFVDKLLDLPGDDVEGENQFQIQFMKVRNREGNTALHVAASRGNTKIVQTLLDKYQDLALETNYLGEMALFEAVREGHAQIVEILLYVTPSGHNMKRIDGRTPLHHALETLTPNKDVMEKLIAYRSELVRERDIRGWTPLHFAALRSMPISPPPIYFMRERRRYRDIRQIYKMLLDKDSSVCYMVDEDGSNPLHLAVINGNAALMCEILHHCRDCSDMVAARGYNLLHLAVEYAANLFSKLGPNFRDIMEHVMEERFINGINVEGETPLDITAQRLKSSDPQLFLAISKFLTRHGGRRNRGLTLFQQGESPTAKESEWNSNIISVNAVLLATVAFTVAFTLPGKPDSAEINYPVFQVLVLFDALAFCFSIASALLLVYALFNSKAEDPILTELSMNTLRVALVSTGITFGAAIHMVVAPKCIWLAVVVWVMVAYLPIWIFLLFSRGKVHLLGTRKTEEFIEEALAFLSTLYEPIRPLVNEFVRAIKFMRSSLAKKVHQS